MVIRPTVKTERITAATDRYPAKVTSLPGYGTVAIRIRAGDAGYSEWMNELQVYLLPNFSHSNVLGFLKSEMYSSSEKVDDHEQQDSTGVSRSEAKRILRNRHKRIEYWLINRFEGCRTLREHLQSFTLTWPQMIFIAKGIASGIGYLHENAEYQDFNEEKMINEFVRSTNGAIAKATFKSSKSIIMMQPHVSLSIIHRNLSSENIAIKPDMSPCIWNFGSSYVHHPFQPTNCKYIIGSELKEMHMTSQYSPPEVLQNRGHLTLASMKSIDMYACGILYWELISRTILPRLDIGSYQEDRERREVGDYKEPFQEEFGDLSTKDLLVHVVCKLGARPRIKDCWLIGKKSNMFVQTLQDLWDHDFDARLHSSTVLDRLDRISLSSRDVRCKHKSRKSNHFDRATMWPPKPESSDHIRYPEDHSIPNIGFLKIPPSRRDEFSMIESAEAEIGS